MKKSSRGIFLLPNLLTTGALFAAFYAIVAAMQGRYALAAIAIFIAMIADALDGRVARLTGTQSDFGAEYDALADMVSFGIAPALLAYSWSLYALGKGGWLVAFIFSAAAALRLARFNSRRSVVDRSYFQGLPSPAAAAVIASFIWLCATYEVSGDTAIRYLFAVIVSVLALLMVSNVRYYSFKDLDLKKRMPFIAGLAIVLLFVAISFDPPLMLLLGGVAYLLSGPMKTVLWFARRRQSRSEQK